VIEERRLGPVVGLGTWNTFDADVELAEQVAEAEAEVGVRLFGTSPIYHAAEHARAGECPWFDTEQRALVGRLAGA
jgi:diketogulonate reductase-like aldo/keto reductase